MLLFCALNYLERFTLPPYTHGEKNVTVAVVVFFFIARMLVYPWQVVGVMRACERYLKDHTDRSWAIAAQGVVVLSALATLAGASSSYQSFLSYKQSLAEMESLSPTPNYSITLLPGDANKNKHGAMLHVQGPFEVGITNALSQRLAEHPEVTGVILDSGGGQIYEGRGMARLIKRHGLATYSLAQCMSSCTTAFIAGSTRTLGDHAKLGFHQYKNYAALPIVDISKEHAKDMDFFKEQGIAPQFMQKIFHQPPQRMWLPNDQELLNSGVIHQRGFSLGGDPRRSPQEQSPQAAGE